jgi:hypothetical protein
MMADLTLIWHYIVGVSMPEFKLELQQEAEVEAQRFERTNTTD